LFANSGAERHCSPDWLKFKNPAAPAVKREAEEDDDGWHWQKSDHDYGPKEDGTYVVEFTTAWGAMLSISIPRNEAGVMKHFQERRPQCCAVAF
jgi:hypothetical protein